MYGSPIDFGFLPPQFNGDVQMFFANQNAITQWQQWVKPRGISMVYMITIAGGGGGGAGFTRASTAAGGGGAGGACSGIAQAIVPAVFLPDVLKISVGLGGAGGATSGTAGAAGTNSYISTGVGLTAGSTIPNLILQSGINAPGGGAAGAAAGAAAIGSAPTATTVASTGGSGVMGIQKFTLGLAGTLGGTPTAAGGAVTTVWSSIPFSAGSGGGGVTALNTGFAGGTLSLQAAVDLPDRGFSPASNYLAGGTAGNSTTAGGNGNSGVVSFKPFLMTGGTGGGSADGQPGGAGGNGGIGCGGGGGGAGTTGGRGGNGGNGLVVIISW